MVGVGVVRVIRMEANLIRITSQKVSKSINSGRVEESDEVIAHQDFCLGQRTYCCANWLINTDVSMSHDIIACQIKTNQFEFESVNKQKIK